MVTLYLLIVAWPRNRERT